MNLFENKRGFTLVELLVVIAIIAVIAAVIFVVLDPVSRLKDARNTQRHQDVNSIADAVRLYQVDTRGQTPPGVDSTWRMIGTSATGCDVQCGATIVAGSYVHNKQADFAGGTYSNTKWNSTYSWIDLVSGSSGTYTSPVINAISSTAWATVSWIPRVPYNKQLPDNKQTETGYPYGNANMSGNIALYHLNEEAGADSFVDTSGGGRNATCTGITCPSAGVAGKFGTAVSFNGAQKITTPVNDTLGDFTVEVWFKDDGDNRAYERLVDKNYTSGFWLGRNNATPNSWGGGVREGSVPYGIYVTLADGGWHQIVSVRSGNVHYIYGDGGRVVRSSTVSNVAINNAVMNIGSWTDSVVGTDAQRFTGMIDEVSVYNRALSASEIVYHYYRGVARLQLQVRSCDDSACSGESFVGPDGTAASYYSEFLNSTTKPPVLNLANINTNQYFQYKFFFDTDYTSHSPAFRSITVGTNAAGAGGQSLPSACVDLGGALGNKLPKLPFDPSFGSATRTYYAIRRDDKGKVSVLSCGAEDEVISANR